MAHPKIMIIGSDNTSDLYGGRLVQELINFIPDVKFFGVGGIVMQESGVDLLYDISGLVNLCGFESLRASHVIKRLTQRMSESMEEFQPKIVIQVGSPVFSLRLIELAKTKGIPVIYYNTPLNSSTNEVKLSRLARIVDKVLAVSRYEYEFCEQYNIDVDFVGHPLVDIVKSHQQNSSSVYQELNLSSQPVLALLPGYCEVEVKTILPTLLKAVKRITKVVGMLQVVTAVPKVVRDECCSEIIAKSKIDNVLVTSKVHEILQIADVAVVTSDAATIEAALVRVPAVAVHKVATTTYFLDKMLTRNSHIATINYLMQNSVMPELIQSDFSDKNVADTVINYLQNNELRTEYLSKTDQLESQFGKSKTIKRAATKISEYLESNC